MTYEMNEMRFYELKGISQVKSYDLELFDLEEKENIYETTLKIDLWYFDIEFVERKITLELPIEISLGDGKCDEIKVEKLIFEVVENQGLNIHFFLNVSYSIEEAIKEDISQSYQEALEEKLETREAFIKSTNIDTIIPEVDSYLEEEPKDASFENMENEPSMVPVEPIQEMLEETIEAVSVLEEETNQLEKNLDNIEEPQEIEQVFDMEEVETKDVVDNMPNMGVREDKTERNLINFETKYDCYKVLSLSDESTFDKISVQYGISLDKLYQLKKEGNRAFVRNKD